MPRKKTSIEPRISAVSMPSFVDFPEEPQALRTEKGTRNQIRADEGTYIWGVDDALPLRILKAVDESPTAMACLGMIETFIEGAGFEDEGLMQMPIDKYGTTLWELHVQLCCYLAQLDGISINFKVNAAAQITNAYMIPFETARYVAPDEGSRTIDEIKVNPYFGTSEYLNANTTCYPVWDKDKSKLAAQIKKYGGEQKFPGQIYHFGIKRPLYKHYPAPKYWSAAPAIYADAKIMEFNQSMLKNGFFQSVLMTMIGDPDAPSTNPKHQTTETGTDGVKRKSKASKTRGEAFDEYASATFSGTKKAGTAMVTWALNKDTAPIVQAFPSTLNFDLLNGTEIQNMRKITVATQVPAILVNLPQQENSLGSDGRSMEMAIELMQSRTSAKRVALEQFYNTVLLPNFVEKTSARVKIKQYRPIKKQFDIPDKVWEAVPAESKLLYIKTLYPEIPIPDAPIVAAPDAPVPGAPQEPTNPTQSADQEAVDAVLRSLSRKELRMFYGYINDYKTGRATLEQTKVFLRAYKLTDDQINLFLNEV